MVAVDEKTLRRLKRAIARAGAVAPAGQAPHSRNNNTSASPAPSAVKSRRELRGRRGEKKACGGASYQSWNLDSQGNWGSFTSNGSTQTRTANVQNQITAISGTTSAPAYDANGNAVSMGLTSQPAGSAATFTYDAWNRLVKVTNTGDQIIAQYTYNAQGYAVTATYPQGGAGVPAGTTNYVYYSSDWQMLEVRTGGTATTNITSQTVWSAAYINAPILQDAYSAGVIQPNSRLYFVQDANWNTTSVVSLVNGTWSVVQRYVYSPYGNIIILNPDWSATPSGTMPMVNNLYQGMALDPVTGLYYERARWYSPSLGTWISQDPAGYINGADTYQYVGDGPLPYGRGSYFRGAVNGRECWMRTTHGHNARGWGGARPMVAALWAWYSHSPEPLQRLTNTAMAR